MGSQPSSSLALRGSESRISTSDPAGRMRSSSVTMRADEPVTCLQISTISPMESVRPVPSWMTSPGGTSVSAARTKPSAVSVAKVKSRLGETAPRRISSAPTSICDRTVGMTARVDWRGP